MATSVSRKIYTAGQATIKWTKDAQGVTFTHDHGDAAINPASLVIQSLDWSKDIPKETITAFGTSAFKRIANEAETVELEMELYPVKGIGAAINLMCKETLKEIPDRVNVETSVGHCSHALLGSVEFEASVGDVPSLSLSFSGMTDSKAILGGLTPSASLSAMDNIATTTSISAGLMCDTYGFDHASTYSDATFNTVFPQSISFSWDGSVETIARLKDAINVVYSFGNPPGEASIEAEGLADPGTVQLIYLYESNSVGAGSTNITIGAHFTGGLGDTASKSVSNAVGELYQTFTSTTEGTAVGVTIV